MSRWNGISTACFILCVLLTTQARAAQPAIRPMPEGVQPKPAHASGNGSLLYRLQSDPHIRIDQFGYLPEASKVAVVREPVVGFDAAGAYSPSPMLAVRESPRGSIVFIGPITAWNNGAVHDQSGDRVWWFDFSALTTPGQYAIVDLAGNTLSEPFEIADDVYTKVARDALRMYYYQRCGVPKSEPFAHADWTDDQPCHIGPGQDSECRSILDQANPATARDLSGGWHDAGDYNKYINFTGQAMHTLLDAYEINQGAWTDDTGIPESGNAVPDILDTARWELEWMLKMQNTDGSVLHKLAVTAHQDGSPPSTDTAPRFYGPPTASATVSACSVFAHAANVYSTLPDQGSQDFARVLESAAVNAWGWLDSNPGQIPSDYDNQGFDSSSSKLSAYDQEMTRLLAAAHLLERTSNTVYRDWFDAHYQNSQLVAIGYAMGWEVVAQDAMLRYRALPQATPAAAADITTRYSDIMQFWLLTWFTNSTDAYRAYMGDADYTWGSNRTRSHLGDMYSGMNRLGIDAPNAPIYRDAAAGHLHFIHGVNPQGYCFLTNMDDAGAGKSVREMFHLWFGDGTAWDNADTSPYGPPPGYLVGGINPSFAPDPFYSGPPLTPPMGQPIQKSYLDWNTDWPQNSWELTECHIPYQAAYLRLLAPFLN